VTEYCAVIRMHSTVCDDKLLYGHVPDPFPRCGHARLIFNWIDMPYPSLL